MTSNGWLRTRTSSEELWLWRKRQPNPRGKMKGRNGSAMSQGQAAQHLNISAQRYHDAEAGKLPERDIKTILALVYGSRQHPFPTVGELCSLARRRTGLIIPQIVEDIGVTRPTLLEWENSGDRRLVAYWQEKGFRF